MTSSIFPERPRSLRDVSIQATSGTDYASSMKEFVDWLTQAAAAPASPDGFYEFDESCLLDEPVDLGSATYMAHLAGMAEFLATLRGSAAPEWTEGPRYFLKEPALYGGRHSRDSMMRSTPGAFRRRLLYCGPALEKLFRLKPRPSAS